MLLLSYYYILFPINLILLFFKFLNLNSYIITHKSSIIKFILKEEKRLDEEHKKLLEIEYEKRKEEEAKKEEERQEKKKQEELLARICKYCNTLDFKENVDSKKFIRKYDNDRHIIEYYDYKENDYVRESVPVHIEEYEITYKRNCCGKLIKKKCRIIINKRTGSENIEILD